MLLLGAIVIVLSLYVHAKFQENAFVDIENISTELNISSKKLVANFLKNEEMADDAYAGKIVEITGQVKEVTFLNNRNTVILYGENNSSGIICDFGTNQSEEIRSLLKNDQVVIKGICKGFLKDVIILNCLLMKTNLDE